MRRLLVLVPVLGLTLAAAAHGANRNGVIAYDRFASHYDQIYTINASGGNKRQLTRAKANSSAPTFSPNGRKIAFQRSSTHGLVLWTMNADGSHQNQIALLKGFQTMGVVTWSADAKRIAFGRPGKQKGIWVARADGTQLQRITRKNDTDPAWSPDGHWIVFDRHTPNPPSNTIWRVPAGGGAAKRLIAGVDDLTPAWSPDGHRIAFSEIDTGTTGSLWVMNADGSGAHAILHFNDFMTDRPAWSPDDSEIAYVLTQGNGIYIVDANGNNRHVIPGTAGAREPSWQPLTG